MKLKFFSILNSLDKDYLPLYENFLFHLKNVGLEKEHELIKLDVGSGQWQSKNFNKICMAKVDNARKFLKEGYTVLYSDLDVVFLKDPLPYLLPMLKEKDILFQYSAKGNPASYNPSPPTRKVCMGFFVAKPTPLNIDLFDTSENVDLDTLPLNHPCRKDQSDQGYTQAKIRQIKKYKQLNQGILPPPLFPNGINWFNNHRDFDPYIIHYNYIVKQSEKIERMKKFGHWK